MKKDKPMTLRRLLSLTRKCIDTYNMIQEGDHIAVGVSGGKDSLTLLIALSELSRFYPKHFTLSAITVDLGNGLMELEPIRSMCEERNIPYYVIDTNIGDVVFHIRQEKGPCALCAKLRKGALDDKAKEIGANKIAYAHHSDDLVETAFMSMIYGGRFYAFSPVTYLSRMELTVIRPLLFCREKEIAEFAKNSNLPVCKNPCPNDGFSKRTYIKHLLEQIYEENPDSDLRLLTAVLEGNIPGWPEKKKS